MDPSFSMARTFRNEASVSFLKKPKVTSFSRVGFLTTSSMAASYWATTSGEYFLSMSWRSSTMTSPTRRSGRVRRFEDDGCADGEADEHGFLRPSPDDGDDVSANAAIVHWPRSSLEPLDPARSTATARTSRRNGTSGRPRCSCCWSSGGRTR